VVSTPVVVEDLSNTQPKEVAVSSPMVVAGVSYAGVVVNDPGVSRAVEAEVHCEVPEGRIEELLESVVGLLLPKLGVQQIRKQLTIAGMPNIHVATMGGDQVLISSPIKGFLKESLMFRRDWWLSWFQGFTRWSVDLPFSGRCVWLYVFGTPVHLWCKNVFELVGSRFGVVIETEVTNQLMYLQG